MKDRAFLNKALYYFSPYEGAFSINMAIRESDKKKLLSDQGINIYHSMIRETEKVNEGYVIRILVDNNEAFKICKNIIERLVEYRK